MTIETRDRVDPESSDEQYGVEFYRARASSYRVDFTRRIAAVEQQISSWEDVDIRTPDTPFMLWGLRAGLKDVTAFVLDAEIENRYLKGDNSGLHELYLDFLFDAIVFLNSMNMAFQLLQRGDSKESAIFAFSAGLAFGKLDQDRLERAAQCLRLSYRNSKREVSAAERSAIKELDHALKAKFPKPTRRFREIADRLDMLPDRVRYIINGPRRKKK